jgi:hypothetical protein
MKEIRATGYITLPRIPTNPAARSATGIKGDGSRMNWNADYEIDFS